MDQTQITQEKQARGASAGLVSEQEAAKILNVTRKTLQNMVYDGKIPPDHYTIAVTRKRFYYRDKILGL